MSCVLIRRLPNNLLAINSFGFGGANVHAVLQANDNRETVDNVSRTGIRLAVACARTADGCEHILKQLKASETNIELQALINDNVYHPSHTHPYRGFALLNSSETNTTIKVNEHGHEYLTSLFS
jgi:fatty acid synthase, animal type